MKRFLTALCLIYLFSLLGITICYAAEIGEQDDRYTSWLSPPSWQQLYAEGRDDQKGMGRIFIPAMTSPSMEPPYAVFQDGELIDETPMGSSMFLKPGNYTILIGSGIIEQRIRREVTITREQTYMLEPDWCAITVEVIDESRNSFKEDLQIYDTKTFQNMGIIPAINPELGEHLETQLLSPGLFKIIERGYDPNTYVNFTTVLLEESTYTPYTVVISSQTGDFIGSGILSSTQRQRVNQNWKMFGVMHGTVVWNSANNVTEKNSKTNISVLAQFDSRITYEKMPYYYLASSLIELGSLRPETGKFQITQDRIQLKNTFVYYLLSWFGGYGRLELTTHAFKTVSCFDSPRNIILRDLNANDTYLNNIKEIKLEPSLFPLGLKEGIGANITPLRTYNARISFRTGFGYRQTYNNDVFRQSSLASNVYERIPNIFVRGIESSLISNLAIWRNLSITTEIDVLFPIDDLQEPVYDLENTTTLSLTRNVSLEHVFRMSHNPAFSWTIQEQFVTVRISYFVF